MSTKELQPVTFEQAKRLKELGFDWGNFIEQEIWKDIADYEGLYQVSSLGGVKRLPLSRINPLTKTFNKNGKILSYSPNNKGYTHNGKEIVPIVECAKIAFPELDFILYEIERRGEFYAQCGDSKRVFYNRGIFYEMDGYGHTHPIEDQYLFFDYLHELKNRLPRPD